MASSFSNALENKILDHIVNKAAYAAPANVYLALLTVAAGEADTAGTITEANYTGYARKIIAPADWAAAASGSNATNTAEAFAACTAGSSVVIGWALCSSAAGAGDVIMYGTCTSTTVSTTQTPATIASGGLALTVD